MCVRTRHFLISLSENLKNKQAKKKKARKENFIQKAGINKCRVVMTCGWSMKHLKKSDPRKVG